MDLNRHGGIGSNCMFAQIGEFNLLIDSGLHPKVAGKEATPNFAALDGHEIDLIVLTHCHLDHLGALPLASARYPEAPIITAIPNLTLAPRMLRNSVNVMKKQREALGLTEYPLFTHRDVAEVQKRLAPQRFGRGEVFYKGEDQLEVILHPAGHVVGAAAVEIIHKHRRIVFSGDVLFEDQRTLPGANLPSGKIDTLILETTRGLTERKPGTGRAIEVERLLKQIRTILERDGSCLIPVFALGRMQEIAQIVYEARNSHQIPRCPIYAAGLGLDLCKYLDEIRQKSGLVQFNAAILEKMKVLPPERKMRPGRDLAKKGIYLVSSGMMVAHTPSYNIAASLLPHPKNGLCFVGYCDPDTPGGKLLAAREKGHFFFEDIDYSANIRASVDQYDLSGHADREELLDYAARSDARSIILNHGDPEARAWFLEKIAEENICQKVLNPKAMELYSV
ncbi:MAG: MBL fold metallo-hydrolase [Verrucomicrobiota bacterium]